MCSPRGGQDAVHDDLRESLIAGSAALPLAATTISPLLSSSRMLVRCSSRLALQKKGAKVGAHAACIR